MFVVQIAFFVRYSLGGERVRPPSLFPRWRDCRGRGPVISSPSCRDPDHVLLHLLFTNDFRILLTAYAVTAATRIGRTMERKPVGAAADDVPAPLHETPSGHERPDGRGGECRSDPPADDQRRNSAHARNLMLKACRARKADNSFPSLSSLVLSQSLSTPYNIGQSCQNIQRGVCRTLREATLTAMRGNGRMARKDRMNPNDIFG